MFLATNDIIRTNLKKALDDPEKGVPGYDDILCDVINTSVQMFENKLYLLPQEKHILIKVKKGKRNMFFNLIYLLNIVKKGDWLFFEFTRW